MTMPGKPLEPATVACEICLKEIPWSEATSEEAVDYVLHFCGLDCYARWKEQGTRVAESEEVDTTPTMPLLLVSQKESLNEPANTTSWSA